MSTARTLSNQGRPGLVHQALFYRNFQELEGRLHDFVVTAANRDEPVLALAPAPSLDVVRRAARDERVELRLEDAGEVARNPSVVLELIEQWVDSHAGHVGVISELIWPGRRHAEVIECLRHEALVGDQLRDAPLSLLCPFDIERLDDEVLQGARLTHPELIWGDGRREPSGQYDPPGELLSAHQWPQDAPSAPVVDLPFEADLHDMRRRVASEEMVEGLPSQRRSDFVFAVNEAVTNSVKHADGHCQVQLWHDGTALVAEVRTRSRLRGVATGRRRPLNYAGGGLGLWLVNQLCDLVELRSDGEETWIRIHVGDSVPVDRSSAEPAGRSAS